MVSVRLELLLLLAAILSFVHCQVPGVVYTESGYDNVNGEDAICWSAPAFHNHTAVEEVLGEEEHGHEDHDDELELEDFNGMNWHSELVPSFVAGPTTMLPSCPSGTDVHVDILPEKVAGSYRLRTNRLYTYHVVGSVDLAAIREQFDLAATSFFYSSDGLHDVGLRIEFCPVNGNLCSPFILERLDSDELDGHLHDEDHDHDDLHDSHDDDSHADDDEEGHEHDGEDHEHDEGSRVLRSKRRVYAGHFLATQPFAFEDGDNHDEDGEHSGGHDEDGEHPEDDDGHSEHDDDGEHSVHDDHDHNDGEHSEHDDHDDYHEGHSFEAGEDQVHHLASPLFLIPVNITNETIFEFHADVDLSIPLPGNYLPLASFQFFMSNETIHGHGVGIDSEAAFKFDVANLLHQRAVFYYEQPDIKTVSSGIEILSYIIIVIAGGIQLFFLVSTCHYRNHSVMKLSQGLFLVALQIAGISASACSFLYNPKSDVYCYLQSPLTLIPLQFMLAIVFGRLRRIIRIMEPLMDWNAPHNRREMTSGLKTWRRAFMMDRSSRSTSQNSSGAKGSNASSNSSSAEDGIEQRSQDRTEMPRRRLLPKAFCRAPIRRKYTAGRLWLVIILVTLPMVIVEIVGLTVFRQELVLDMNADQSAGKFECGTQDEQIYHLASTAVLLITMFAALCEAQRSRRLPGLFNEAGSVSIALISSLFVITVGFAVIIVSSDPSANPNAAYIMEVIMVTFIATSLVGRLTLPKLRLIWKGEKVVISKMLQEHKRSQELSSTDDAGRSTGFNGASGLSAPGPRASLPSKQLQSDSSRRDSDDIPKPQRKASERSVTFDDAAAKGIAVDLEAKPSRRGLVVRSGQAPPMRLTMQVVKHSNTMSRVNERILSGLLVDENDWGEVKASLEELHGLLDHAEYVSSSRHFKVGDVENGSSRGSHHDTATSNNVTNGCVGAEPLDYDIPQTGTIFLDVGEFAA